MAVPTDIAGLQLWFKADSLSLSDNDPVGTWADSSGNARDGVQGTAGKKPTFKTNILNSLPVVRFDGGDNLLHGYSIATANTIFAVAKMTGTTGEQIVISASLGGGSLAAYIRGRSGGANWGTYRNGDVTANTDISSAYKIICIVTRSGTDLDLVTNGNVETKVASGYYSDSTHRVRIGSGDDNENPFDGDIAEVFLYDSALNSTDRESMEAYLTAKWFGGGGGNRRRRAIICGAAA